MTSSRSSLTFPLAVSLGIHTLCLSALFALVVFCRWPKPWLVPPRGFRSHLLGIYSGWAIEIAARWYFEISGIAPSLVSLVFSLVSLFFSSCLSYALLSPPSLHPKSLCGLLPRPPCLSLQPSPAFSLPQSVPSLTPGYADDEDAQPPAFARLWFVAVCLLSWDIRNNARPHPKNA
jgi:hypothetical protein